MHIDSCFCLVQCSTRKGFLRINFALIKCKLENRMHILGIRMNSNSTQRNKPIRHFIHYW